MEPFISHTGIVAPFDRANVDTDAIIPKQFLKRIERSGFGQFLFYDFRFDEHANPNPDFSLNQDRFRHASVLISRSNFGCGSSREHAPWALLDYGFRVIVASSFADIFYNNCFNNGILPVRLDPQQIDLLFQNTQSLHGYALNIDLKTQTISDDFGFSSHFEVDDWHKNKLLNGLDDIGITLGHLDKIEAFEKNHTVYSSQP
jgi:3-isopropylmalate/(R)-2-methylmalate dehydratase small subunit